MASLALIDLLSRWTHVGSVIVLVGGVVFQCCVLLPSVSVLADTQRDMLQQRVAQRWRAFALTLIALIVVSGLYNMARRLESVTALWHALFGVKILLAVGFCFVVSALVGRSSRLASLRRHPAYWLRLAVALAAVTVMISGMLKFLPR